MVESQERQNAGAELDSAILAKPRRDSFAEKYRTCEMAANRRIRIEREAAAMRARNAKKSPSDNPKRPYDLNWPSSIALIFKHREKLDRVRERWAVIYELNGQINLWGFSESPHGGLALRTARACPWAKNPVVVRTSSMLEAEAVRRENV